MALPHSSQGLCARHNMSLEASRHRRKKTQAVDLLMRLKVPQQMMTYYTCTEDGNAFWADADLIEHLRKQHHAKFIRRPGRPGIMDGHGHICIAIEILQLPSVSISPKCFGYHCAQLASHKGPQLLPAHFVQRTKVIAARFRIVTRHGCFLGPVFKVEVETVFGKIHVTICLFNLWCD
ncbi:hypothetical protein M747DRAFT_327007 [Aspergillus niger ATCC 13496]|uniref:C2H2-type domain-containing protein n=3 Tax=Aspergillus niger TaxID=5061 RepID=A2QSN6_ASPNC|nr:hypothetical protein An08g11370 [Aspergillus niger]RDH14110.1 hypothetical protein M747DRAFT_327007 [Aspergillus niger ATCC 13496]CAK45808.1 hypothetical protein An08g11370 [Aspergillus niger]